MCGFFLFSAQKIFKVQYFDINDLKDLLEEEHFQVFDGKVCHLNKYLINIHAEMRSMKKNAFVRFTY